MLVRPNRNGAITSDTRLGGENDQAIGGLVPTGDAVFVSGLTQGRFRGLRPVHGSSGFMERRE
jgi:hypothetical protein